MTVSAKPKHLNDFAPELRDRHGVLLASLHDRQRLDARRSDLVDEAARVWSRPGFDVLLSRSSLRFEPFDF